MDGEPGRPGTGGGQAAWSEPVAALRALLDERLDGAPDPELVRALAPTERPHVSAIVLYGSCLSPRTAARDSEPDLFLVVDDLSTYLSNPIAALWGRLLPPAIFHPVLPFGGVRRRCKLCVITSAQLARETSPEARDLHHLGRFSKPLKLLWARNPEARARVLDAQLAALRTLTPLALTRLPDRFPPLRLVEELYALSYRAEVRMAEPGKVASILASDPERHDAVARLLLAAEGIAVDGEQAIQPAPRDGDALEILLTRARRRERLRWPGYLLTFDGWLEYLLRKLERNGVHVQLSPAQMRHPLLLGWPALFRLQRRGLVR